MRVRRASFFPREERTSAVTVISFLTLLSPQRVRSPFTLVAPAVLPPVFSRFSWVRYPAIFYTNNVLTEVSSWIDRMASAISLAIDSDLIRLLRLASSEKGIEFVQTTSVNSDSSIRCTAGPERTACVAQADTLARSEEHT